MKRYALLYTLLAIQICNAAQSLENQVIVGASYYTKKCVKHDKNKHKMHYDFYTHDGTFIKTVIEESAMVFESKTYLDEKAPRPQVTKMALSYYEALSILTKNSLTKGVSGYFLQFKDKHDNIITECRYKPGELSNPSSGPFLMLNNSYIPIPPLKGISALEKELGLDLTNTEDELRKDQSCLRLEEKKKESEESFCSIQ